MERLGDKEAALRLGRGGRPVPLRQLFPRQKGSHLLLKACGADRLDFGHSGDMLWEEAPIDEPGGAESAVEAGVGAAGRRYAGTENPRPVHLGAQSGAERQIRPPRQVLRAHNRADPPARAGYPHQLSHHAVGIAFFHNGQRQRDVDAAID
jgi:hypothetical protein